MSALKSNSTTTTSSSLILDEVQAVQQEQQQQKNSVVRNPSLSVEKPTRGRTISTSTLEVYSSPQQQHPDRPLRSRSKSPYKRDVIMSGDGTIKGGKPMTQGSFKGKGLAVFTSGGDSQGNKSQ
jgi:hypothetical protein